MSAPKCPDCKRPKAVSSPPSVAGRTGSVCHATTRHDEWMIDCLRAQITTERALSDALADDLEEALTYVPDWAKWKHAIGEESLAKHRAARAKDPGNE